MADAIGVDHQRLLLTNGGSEAISLATSKFGGRVHAEPDFALLPRITTNDGFDATSAEADDNDDNDDNDNNIYNDDNNDGPIWRSDPNNPTGTLADSSLTCDIWDEAFYPLATGTWTAHRPSLATVGSLTKVFACPGIRLGYVISDAVDELSRLQPKWSVNSLALAMLPDLLELADLPTWHTQITHARSALVNTFETHNITVSAADAPWILAHHHGLRERLIPHGIVVRDCTNFGLKDTYRVAVCNNKQLERLSTALDTLQ